MPPTRALVWVSHGVEEVEGRAVLAEGLGRVGCLEGGLGLAGGLVGVLAVLHRRGVGGARARRVRRRRARGGGVDWLEGVVEPLPVQSAAAEPAVADSAAVVGLGGGAARGRGHGGVLQVVALQLGPRRAVEGAAGQVALHHSTHYRLGGWSHSQDSFWLNNSGYLLFGDYGINKCQDCELGDQSKDRLPVNVRFGI